VIYSIPGIYYWKEREKKNSTKIDLSHPQRYYCYSNTLFPILKQYPAESASKLWLHEMIYPRHLDSHRYHYHHRSFQECICHHHSKTIELDLNHFNQHGPISSDTYSAVIYSLVQGRSCRILVSVSYIDNHPNRTSYMLAISLIPLINHPRLFGIFRYHVDSTYHNLFNCTRPKFL